MRVVGIDTDSKGSIAVLDTDAKTVTIYYIPSSFKEQGGKKRAILLRRKLAEYANEIFQEPVDFVYFEEQWSRPNQDAGGTFTFGCVYCMIIQAFEDAAYYNNVAEYNPRFVSGLEWKIALKLSKDKSLSIKLADKLFPLCEPAWEKASKTVKSSGEYTSAPEALLIAFYGSVIQHNLLRLPLNVNEFQNYKLVLKTPKRVTTE